MKALVWKRRIFQNERGRDIHIEVGDRMDGEVLIRVSSPDSMSENFLTRKEATMLRDALIEWSGGNPVEGMLSRLRPKSERDAMDQEAGK